MELIVRNQLMDKVLQQHGIDHIFSAPYHPQSNGKLEVFHTYLKPTLRKLCEKDPIHLDKYINQVLTSYQVTWNLATVGDTFFSSLQKRGQANPYINLWTQCNVS